MEEIIEQLRRKGQEVINNITWRLEVGEQSYGPNVEGYDYIMRSFKSICDSYDVDENIVLEFIDVDKEKNTLAINEDKLQRVAKEINQKRIEAWRAKGENTIKSIINFANTVCKDKTKEEKNNAIIAMLAQPQSGINQLQSLSMGFIELDEEHSIPVINEEKLIRRAKGKNIEILKEKLLNNEMSFAELDYMLVYNGYESVIYNRLVYGYDNVIYNRYNYEPIEVKENLSVEYVAKDTCEAEISIVFDITKDNKPGESSADFYLKVTDIKRI